MKTVLEYLEYSAAVRPHAVAVEDAGGTATFQELEVGCRKVGSALTERIALREPVAIFLEKGRQALWAFWGTVYAGGFYVPLNPDLPPARLRQIQSVLQANYVITDRAHRVRALEIFSPEAILDVEELLAAPLQPARLEAVRSQVVDTDPLYTNFTSGSTGQPKGVVVSHRSVIDFIDTFVDCFGMDHTDILANQAPFDFDVSVKDLYTMLKTGAKLSVVPKELFSRPKELLDWLCDRKVTSLTWAVSALCLISTFHGLDYRVPETVRRVLFSGEVMPEKHLRAWRTHLPEAVFVNLYGPTEITCNCTYHILHPDRDYPQGIPIGKPFPNERVFLLDQGDRVITRSNTRATASSWRRSSGRWPRSRGWSGASAPLRRSGSGSLAFTWARRTPTRCARPWPSSCPVTWCPRCSAPVRPSPSIRTEKWTGKPCWKGGRPHDRPATAPSAPSRNHAAVRL